MASALPSLFVALAGLCLALVLFQLWQSLRILLARGKALRLTSAPGHAHAGREALLREKDELLTAIRDVRSEHDLGKLSAADSQQLEQRYRTRARDVLRNLDEQLAPYRERARALLEETPPGAGDAARAGESNPAQAAAEKSAGESKPARAAGEKERLKCAACGSSNDTDAVFCKKCGARVAAGADS
jgi:hypothetical protein